MSDSTHRESLAGRLESLVVVRMMERVSRAFIFIKLGLPTLANRIKFVRLVCHWSLVRGVGKVYDGVWAVSRGGRHQHAGLRPREEHFLLIEGVDATLLVWRNRDYSCEIPVSRCNRCHRHIFVSSRCELSLKWGVILVRQSVQVLADLHRFLVWRHTVERSILMRFLCGRGYNHNTVQGRQSHDIATITPTVISRRGVHS